MSPSWEELKRAPEGSTLTFILQKIGPLHYIKTEKGLWQNSATLSSWSSDSMKSLMILTDYVEVSLTLPLPLWELG